MSPFLVCHTRLQALRGAARDDQLRLVAGGAGAGYEFSRLEIFLRGFWSNICDLDSFTPATGQVACRALGYDGGGPLEFRQELSFGEANEVISRSFPAPQHICTPCTGCSLCCCVPAFLGGARPLWPCPCNTDPDQCE